MTDLLTARTIIEALSDGVDPRSGDLLAPGSPIDSSDVIRALHAAITAIDCEMRRRGRRAVLPPQAGKPWPLEDDQKLAELFDSGQPVSAIAKAFQRTRGAIASRLVRLEKVSDRQSAFVANLQLPSKWHHS